MKYVPSRIYDQVRPIKVADGYQDALPLPLFNSTSHFKQQIDFLKAELPYVDPCRSQRFLFPAAAATRKIRVADL